MARCAPSWPLVMAALGQSVDGVGAEDRAGELRRAEEAPAARHRPMQLSIDTNPLWPLGAGDAHEITSAGTSPGGAVQEEEEEEAAADVTEEEPQSNMTQTSDADEDTQSALSLAIDSSATSLTHASGASHGEVAHDSLGGVGPVVGSSSPELDPASLGPGGADLAAAVSDLWSLYERTEEDGEVRVSRSAYTAMYIRMARVLYAGDSFDHQEALRSATTDWSRDTTHTYGRMNLACFTRSMAEVARQWTSDGDWTKQAAFLNAMYERLAAHDDDGATKKTRRGASFSVGLTERFAKLWREKYGSSGGASEDGSGGGGGKRSERDALEAATRARVERHRAHERLADSRVNTRGRRLFSHVGLPETALEYGAAAAASASAASHTALESLCASGASNAITLYTPWQPSWSSFELSHLAHGLRDLAPPQTEPVYTLRSSSATEAAIARQAREHRFEREWRSFVSVRPQTAEEHIAAGLHSDGSSTRRRLTSADDATTTTTGLQRGAARPGSGVAASSLPVHAPAAGTTHLSFIPFTTPSFPIAAGASTTTHARSARPSPHTHAHLQPRPPLPARVRPHSAAATRIKHVSGHRAFLRRLTSERPTTAAEVVEALLPKDESERARMAGPLIAAPRHHIDDDDAIAANDTTALLAVSVPARATRSDAYDEDDDGHDGEGADENRPPSSSPCYALPPPPPLPAGHVHPAAFTARVSRIQKTPLDRPRSAVAANQLRRSDQLALKETTTVSSTESATPTTKVVSRPLLLMSGEPATSPFASGPHRPPRPPPARPLSANEQTLSHLEAAAVESADVGAKHSRRILDAFRRRQQRPHTARMYDADANTSAAQAAQRPHSAVEVEPRPTANSNDHQDAKDNTFLTSLAHADGDDDGNEDSDEQEMETDYANFVMPSRAPREHVSEEKEQPSQHMVLHVPQPDSMPIEDAAENSTPLEEASLVSPPSTSPLVESASSTSVVSVGLDPSLLVSHPILGHACLTVPPRRPAHWPIGVGSMTGVEVGAASLAHQLDNARRTSAAARTQSWSWTTRLLAPTTTTPARSDADEDAASVSILPPADVDPKTLLARIRRNKARASIFNSRAPEQTWLVVSPSREEEAKEVVPERINSGVNGGGSSPPHAAAHGPVPLLQFDTLPTAVIPTHFVGDTSAARRERKVAAAARAAATRSQENNRPGAACIDLSIGSARATAEEEEKEEEESNSSESTFFTSESASSLESRDDLSLSLWSRDAVGPASELTAVVRRTRAASATARRKTQPRNANAAAYTARSHRVPMHPRDRDDAAAQVQTSYVRHESTPSSVRQTALQFAGSSQAVALRVLSDPTAWWSPRGRVAQARATRATQPNHTAATPRTKGLVPPPPRLMTGGDAGADSSTATATATTADQPFDHAMILASRAPLHADRSASSARPATATARRHARHPSLAHAPTAAPSHDHLYDHEDEEGESDSKDAATSSSSSLRPRSAYPRPSTAVPRDDASDASSAARRAFSATPTSGARVPGSGVSSPRSSSRRGTAPAGSIPPVALSRPASRSSGGTDTIVIRDEDDDEEEDGELGGWRSGNDPSARAMSTSSPTSPTSTKRTLHTQSVGGGAPSRSPATSYRMSPVMARVSASSSSVRPSGVPRARSSVVRSSPRTSSGPSAHGRADLARRASFMTDADSATTTSHEDSTVPPSTEARSPEPDAALVSSTDRTAGTLVAPSASSTSLPSTPLSPSRTVRPVQVPIIPPSATENDFVTV